MIVGSDAWTGRRRDELVGTLKTKPGLRRYLRRTTGGLKVESEVRSSRLPSSCVLALDRGGVDVEHPAPRS